jgi:hypothetical protein
MAEKVTHSRTCDDCEDDGLPDVEAPRQYAISINGAPFKLLDFCIPSDRAVMSRLVKLYEERGVELPPKPAPEEKPARKSVTSQRKPKELTAPAQSKEPAAKKPSREKKTDERIRQHITKDDDKRARGAVWCPKEHPQKNGAGSYVVYANRPSHAEQCHKGAKVWDIKWEDPDGILTVPCTSHAECLNTGLLFKNKAGLTTHINTCALPRIDNQPSGGKTDD